MIYHRAQKLIGEGFVCEEDSAGHLQMKRNITKILTG